MGFFSSPDPPPAPDYRASAEAQGEANLEALQAQTYANRATQATPWGTLSWTPGTTTDPTTGRDLTTWTQQQSLAPNLESALASQFRLADARSGTALGLWPQAYGAFQTPLDYGQFRDVTELGDPNSFRQAGEDAAYARMTSRLDPRFQEEEAMLTTRLRNQGLRPGDAAYEAEMDRFNRRQTDAYQTAMNEAAQAGRAESSLAFGQGLSQQAQSAALRSQEIAEALQRRGLPLEEINMLLAGQGVQPPQAPGYSQAGRATPTDIFGATQAQFDAATDAFNYQQGARQSRNEALMNLGTAALGMFSDRRLKTGIRRVGTTAGGTPLYRFRYIWGGPVHIGVMADEVPEAAFEHPSGFLMVDYGRVS